MEKREHTLPPGWIEMTIGDVGKTYSGGTPKTSDPKNFDGNVPWITPADLTGYAAKYIAQGRRNITKKGLESSSAKLVPEGTVLFSSRAPIGYVAIASNLMATNQGFKSVKPAKNIESDYVYYYLKASKQLAENNASGTTFKELSGSRFVKLPIPIAPLNEQRRIVDKIETLFSDLDKGEENLRHVQILLKRYRQSVLKASVTGELTKSWFKEHSLPEWKDTLIENVIFGKPRNGFSPKGVNYETPVKNLTLTATTSGIFKPEHFKYVDIGVKPDSHLWLEDGDILIQRANSIDYVGVSAIYRGPEKAFIYPDLMMKVQTKKELITSEFLHLVLSSSPVRIFFKSNATGTAGSMPKINQKIVMAAPLMLPSIEEQKEIVSQVEDIFSQISTLETWCATELKRSSTLRQSVLKSAFSGQLVPQDPTDEPASELLKRIQLERASAVPAPARGRKSRKESAL